MSKCVKMWQSEGVRLQKQHVPWRSRGRTSYRGCDYVVNTVSVKGNHWVYNRRLIEKEAEMRKRRSERETQREGMRKREKTCGLRVAEMEIKQHPHHTELYNHLLTHMLNSAPMTHTHILFKSAVCKPTGTLSCCPIRDVQTDIFS